MNQQFLARNQYKAGQETGTDQENQAHVELAREKRAHREENQRKKMGGGGVGVRTPHLAFGSVDINHQAAVVFVILVDKFPYLNRFEPAVQPVEPIKPRTESSTGSLPGLVLITMQLCAIKNS